MRNQRYHNSVSSFPAKPALPQIVPHFLRKSGDSPLNGAPPRFQPRIALYSGGRDGTALRRNISIAHALKTSHLKANILLLTEPHNNPAITPPRGLTCIHLPAIGGESSRTQLALETLTSFKPDAVVIDTLPLGLKPEFDEIINLLQRSDTRSILGLSDSPTYTIPEQAQHLFDQIWAYGDCKLYDFTREYNFTNGTRKKVCYTGYLDYLQQQKRDEQPQQEEQLIIFSLGEIDDYAKASETLITTPLPPNSRAVLITGASVPSHIKNGLRQLTAVQERIDVIDHGDDAGKLLADADRIVAMGSNVTLSEALGSDKPALLISSRQKVCHALKQLANLNIAEVLNSREATSERIASWLQAEIGNDRPSSKAHIDFGGLSRLPGLLGTLLTTNRRQPSRQPF